RLHAARGSFASPHGRAPIRSAWRVKTKRHGVTSEMQARNPRFLATLPPLRFPPTPCQKPPGPCQWTVVDHGSSSRVIPPHTSAFFAGSRDRRLHPLPRRERGGGAGRPRRELVRRWNLP